MSRDRRSLPKWIIVPTVLVIGVVSVFLFQDRLLQLIPVPYYKSEAQIVEAAIKEAFGAEPSASVRRRSYPVVVDLPDMTCVGFNLRPGWIGATQTVCFRKSDGSVAVRHSR